MFDGPTEEDIVFHVLNDASERFHLDQSTESESDVDIMSNNILDWIKIQRNIEGPTEENILGEFDFVYPYDNLSGEPLLAYALLARLQCQCFSLLMREDIGHMGYNNDRYHTSLWAYKKLIDKWAALSEGKTTWSHVWMN